MIHVMKRIMRSMSVAGVLLVSAVALAQQPGQAPAPPPFRPPTPAAPGKPPLVWNILTALVIGAGVVAVCLIPSKRTHQD